MALFRLPAEIRLTIYAELLVSSEPIDMPETRWGSMAWPGAWDTIDVSMQRWPAILRTSKQVHSEAVVLLYSHNRFRFLDMPLGSDPRSSRFSRFLEQIGAHARTLLRHVSLSFPVTHLEDDTAEMFGFESTYAGAPPGVPSDAWQGAPVPTRPRDVDCLCDACPDIATLELFLAYRRTRVVLQFTRFLAEAVDYALAQLATLAYMPAVRVTVELRDESTAQTDDDTASVEQDNPPNNAPEEDEEDLRPYEASLQLLRSRGWALNIIRIPLLDSAESI